MGRGVHLGSVPTSKNAALTFASVISLLRHIFSTRSLFEPPELRHAMVLIAASLPLIESVEGLVQCARKLVVVKG